MSTRSAIGYYDPATKNVRAVYCHFDGYWEGVGQMLVDYYKEAEKVRALVELGDMSSLNKEVSPPVGVAHSFDNRCPGVTVFYGRDRGETGIETGDYSSMQEIEDGIDCEYVYIFASGRWFGYHIHSGDIRVDNLPVGLALVDPNQSFPLELGRKV